MSLLPVMCYLQMVIFAFVALSFIGSTNGSNILFLTPITFPSHSNFIKPVVKELDERGHFVTYWNGLETKLITSKNTTNLRILNSPNLNRLNVNHNVDFNDRDSPFRLFFDFPNRMATYCNAIYEDPVFHQLANSKEHYDLIVVEGTFNECVLQLVRIFDAPFVYMHSIAPTPWLLDTIASPLSFSHFPYPAYNFDDEMNFWQRILNAKSGLIGLYFYRWFVAPVAERIAFEMLGADNITTIQEIEDRYLSLLILNTHFSINFQLPTTSSVIEVGGLHCAPAKALPEVSHLVYNVVIIITCQFLLTGFGRICSGFRRCWIHHCQFRFHPKRC